MRWNRMYLLLRADQRLKQNHEDELLPAYLQELYLSVKDLGLILSQKIIRLSLTQCQNNWVLFLRHGHLPREDDGAIEFWRIKDYLQTLVWCKVEEHHGKRRRNLENISVLYWFFRRSSLPPSSPRSFRTQSCWSFITGQCLDPGRFLQVRLSRWMCNQFTFHHQSRIDTGRSKFEQKTDGVLLACWSKRWKSQRPWIYRLLCTTSRAIHAQCMEETSRRGILGRYWSWNQRRINVLSDTIECNYSSRKHS